MGKISDALEKAAREPKKTPPSVGRKPDREPRIPPAEDKKILSLEGKKKATAFRRQAIIKPDENAPLHPDVVCALKPNSFESEQFKMLRTRVLFPPTGEPPRTIMVTSALPGEGKSFVAANLAVSIAQNINEYVLLMDCDLRLPSVGKLFGNPAAPGLSEHLSSGARLDDLLVKTNIEKLTLLTGGRPPSNPSELLSSRRMNDLLQEISGRYDDRYIVIDAPPPNLTAEAHVMAKKVDGIILVVRYRGASNKLVKELVETLGKDKILGVVFNRVRVPVLNYYGYGKYGKYKYGSKDK